jgi:two-component system, OmpR family, sensor kinase
VVRSAPPFDSETEKLQLRIRELEAAVRARDEFVATLAHELRNPLSPIFLSAQHLVDHVREGRTGALPSERLLSALENFLKRMRRFLEVLDQLLEVSRASSGKLELQLEDGDMGDIGREVCASMEREIAAAQVSLQFEADGDARGRWDSLRVEQIVRNLLSNAVRYGAGKPVFVGVRGRSDAVSITVQDHGIGIAPEDQHRIFERFERAARGGSRRGFGVGLWLVKELCSALGGRIELSSRLGEGATFVVSLPRRVTETR